MIFYCIAAALILVWLYFYFTGFTKNPRDLQGTLEEIQQKYSPHQGRWAARKEKKVAEARAGVVAALNIEAAQVRAFEDQQAQANSLANVRDRNEELSNATHKTQVAAQEFQTYIYDNNKILIDSAAANNMDLATYMKVREAQALNEANLQQDERKALSEIKFAVFAKKMGEHVEIGHVQRQLDELYTEVYQLNKSDEPEELKQRKITAREKTIKTIEKDKAGREKKLLQAYYGQDKRRVGEKADDTGDPKSPLGSNPE